MMTSSPGKLVVLSGPSGAGKSSVARGAIARTDAQFSVSATTRSPRPGEVDGRHYWFIDRPKFERMIRDGELLEWAEVFGRLYGTPSRPVRQAVAQGRTILLDIDVQGGRQVHEKMPEATFVLILPPSEEELVRRLEGRGTEDRSELRRRLQRAHEEIEDARASGVYNHEIVNDDLEQAVRQVVETIES